MRRFQAERMLKGVCLFDEASAMEGKMSNKGRASASAFDPKTHVGRTATGTRKLGRQEAARHIARVLRARTALTPCPTDEPVKVLISLQQ